MIEVAPGTVVLFSDLSCPWAHAAVHRFWEQRARLGLEDKVVLNHRFFPLELHNDRGTPKHILEAEIPVAGGLAPEAGWQVWQGPVHEWASSLLLAMEAVQAAKQQSLKASEALDRALRRAFFAHSRNISMHHEIVDVAGAIEDVDAGLVEESLEDGRMRRTLFEDRVASASGEVKGSPHFFLPDGTNAHNPGVELHWEGEHGQGFPVIDADDPQAFERLLQSAADVQD
ncbi:MAG: DsbA family protein [Actinomycetota bacterium]|nr:DsbA family protein [Actinomycetota bacterium]